MNGAAGHRLPKGRGGREATVAGERREGVARGERVWRAGSSRSCLEGVLEYGNSARFVADGERRTQVVREAGGASTSNQAVLSWKSESLQPSLGSSCSNVNPTVGWTTEPKSKNRSKANVVPSVFPSEVVAVESPAPSLLSRLPFTNPCRQRREESPPEQRTAR